MAKIPSLFAGSRAMDSEERRAEKVMADLQNWAKRHGYDPAVVLVDAAEAYLRCQGAADYAELNTF